MMKKKIMGLDYGRSRMGLAMADDLLLFSHPLETVPAHPKKACFDRIIKLLLDNRVDELVVGLPKKTDGTKSDMGQEVQAYCSEIGLVLPDLKISFVDERFTTSIAKGMLTKSGIRAKSQKNIIDQQAACIILQDYLDSLRR